MQLGVKYLRYKRIVCNFCSNIVYSAPEKNLIFWQKFDLGLSLSNQLRLKMINMYGQQSRSYEY